MNNKKQFVLVNLLTGRNYVGYISEDFSPNFSDDMSFILYNAHYFFTKLNKSGDPHVELVGIADSPEGFSPDMEIMWQSVATVQYLTEESYLVKKIEEKNKDEEVTENKESIEKKPNLIVLNSETCANKKGQGEEV